MRCAQQRILRGKQNRPEGILSLNFTLRQTPTPAFHFSMTDCHLVTFVRYRRILCRIGLESVQTR